jgi:hypothetical protein
LEEGGEREGGGQCWYPCISCVGSMLAGRVSYAPPGSSAAQGVRVSEEGGGGAMLAPVHELRCVLVLVE